MLKKAKLEFLDIDNKFHLSDDDIDDLIYNLDWKFPLSDSRGIYNMGNHYDFSNIRATGEEFKEPVKRLMEAINDKYGYKLNSCLLNYYSDGKVTIGHHSDNCNKLRGGYASAIVVSISYYATRKMEFVSRNRQEKLTIDLNHGDILLMGSGCQQHYLHAIVKDAKCLGHRINLTFREFI